MNLLTQDEDFDLDELMMTQQPATPTTSGKVHKRSSNYNHNEDIQLCISWENISNDPIVGNEQPGKAYWQRIADHYHANRTFDSDRTVNSLEHRWATIQKECQKFQGCFESIERRHPSGVPYKERLMEAQATFARDDPKRKPCQFIHCWLQIRHSEKFLLLEANKRPKVSYSSAPSSGEQNEEGGSTSHDTGASNSSIPPPKNTRPPGRKQSKEKLKNGGGHGEYKEVMQNLLVVKTEESKLKMERWNKTQMLEERRLEIEERRLKWEQEQKIMFCDVSGMEPAQRTYVLAMRAEIAAAKVASLSSAGFVDTSGGSTGGASTGGSGSFGGQFDGGEDDNNGGGSGAEFTGGGGIDAADFSSV